MEVKMKKSLSDKMLMMNKPQVMMKKSSRLLINVNVFGSAGPIRFVVNEDDKVVGVIHMALKQYAREGRLPVLGSDAHDFFLYPATSGFEQALSASNSIGNCGERNFILCKKHRQPLMTEGRSEVIGMKGTRTWKSWLTKLNL